MFGISPLYFKLATQTGVTVGTARYHLKTVFSFPVLQPYVFKVIISDIAVTIVDVFSMNVLF